MTGLSGAAEAPSPATIAWGILCSQEEAVAVNNTSLPAAVAQPRGSPFRRLLLSGRDDFWRLWFVGLVVFVVRWLETIAVGIVVYQRTGSAFLVAMMTMLRLLPMGLFGAFLGALAERIERRTALIAVVILMGSTSFTLAVLAHTGRLAVWHLALASFLNGVAWATDNPVRRVMIGEVVGADQMSTAMSIDVGANNASRMLGPTVGGLLLVTIGIDGAFTLSVLLYTAALLTALRVRYRNAALPARPGAVLARMLEGFALVRSDQRLRRHAGRDRHLQRVRLAVHQHGAGDRPRPPAPRPRAASACWPAWTASAPSAARCWPRCSCAPAWYAAPISAA